MANITINLPIMDAEHKIEIEVKVNGKAKKYHYRVELFNWEECEEVENFGHFGHPFRLDSGH